MADTSQLKSGNAAGDLATTSSSTAGASAELPPVVVMGNLDQAREEIVPSLGATVYTITQQEIQDLSQGDNESLSKLVLRFPGVSQDSEGSGSFHVRDEHANVQYRIDDILIPESITSFGSQFGTRFIDQVDLITGALPAEYGFRESGVVDLHTKNGAIYPGGDVEMYGGSHGEMNPSFEYGGSQGKLNYYFSGSYLQDSLGIENPISSSGAIHDQTSQYRGFAYLSYVVDPTSRFSLIAGEAYNQFQIPNTPGLPAGVDGVDNPFAIPGVTSFDSSALNESQREQNNFEILAYQKSLEDFKFQVSVFNSYSAVNFNPDDNGDLYFNGVAGKLNRSVSSNGMQFDSGYQITNTNTVRAGLLLNAQGSSQFARTTVIPEDSTTGVQDGAPVTTSSNDYSTAYSYGIYLQDEWKIASAWTLNFGGRFDLYQSSQIRQNQLSPRINLTYQSGDTTIHGGYASYFTPPPLENIPQGSVGQFQGTTNAATPGLPDDPVESERAQYFDVGIVRHFTPAYQVGLDGYYKVSQNTLDDGQFGAAPILSAFNYRSGQICGLELSQIFHQGSWSAYANIAVEEGIGTQVNSAQSVLFSAEDDKYINSHYIYLDHSQTFTGSLGLSYEIKQTETTPYIEIVTGSGLRTDLPTVPNGGSLPPYDSINMGFSQSFKWAGLPNVSARFDVINVADQIYELRDGSGVGVFAPQFGQRRSFYGGLTYFF